MRVSYSTAQLAHQAILDAPEQAALHLLDDDDAAGLAVHGVLDDACFARTTRLFDVCLQNDALQCAWLLLQRTRPEDDVQARRARQNAMRLSKRAMTACTRAKTCAQKQPMATLATRACDYAVNRGYTRASVQVMHAAAEAFFLTAFEMPRVLYGGTRSVRQSPSVQLWMSLALLRFIEAQHFDAQQALELLHAVLRAFAQDATLRPLVCEDVRALCMPLDRLVHNSTDARCLKLAQQCVRDAQKGLGNADPAFRRLHVQIGVRLALVDRQGTQDGWDGFLPAIGQANLCRPAAVCLAAPKHVRFTRTARARE